MGPSLAEGQAAHTSKVRKGSGEGMDRLAKSLEKDQDDFMKLVMETSKRPSLNPEHQDLTPMIMSGFKSATATLKQAQIAAEAAKVQEQSMKYQKAATMSGQKVRVDNSLKSFSAERGERVKYQFELMGKNLPKGATINGHLIIRDKKGKKIRTENLKSLNIGKNTFTWDGQTDMKKLAEAGEYKIEVRASYTSPESKGAKHVIAVNTSTEEVIKQVNMDGTYVLENGRKIDDESQIVSFVNMSSDDKKKIHNPIQSANNPNSLIGKTVTIDEKNFEYNGGKVNLGFNAKESNKNAKVKLIVRNENGQVATYVEEMTIQEGRNLFEWKGYATKNDKDIQDQKAGKTFNKIPKGNYEYAIYIQDANSQWNKAESRHSVNVSGTEPDGLDTRIISENGDSYSIKSIESVSATKQPENQASLEDLKKEARNYLNTRVEVVDNIIEYDGSMNWERTFPVSWPSDSSKNGPLRITIRDQENNIVKALEIDQNNVDGAIEAAAVLYEEMTDESQTNLNNWITNTFNAIDTDLGYDSYKSVAQDDHLAMIHAHMIQGARDGTYKYNTVPGVTATWDGKNDAGGEVEHGAYSFEALSHIVKASDETVENTFHYPKNQILAVTTSRVTDDREIELTLQDGRKIDLGDVKAWVS